MLAAAARHAYVSVTETAEPVPVTGATWTMPLIRVEHASTCAAAEGGASLKTDPQLLTHREQMLWWRERLHSATSSKDCSAKINYLRFT